MLEHLFTSITDSTPTDNYPDLDDERDLIRRVRNLQSADPDPYGLHKIPIQTRLIYMEHYLITGNYLI